MITQAVLLAGGEGTRLRPVTFEIPKPLVPVQGVPIATWLVRLFARSGVARVTVIFPTRWKAQFEAWAASPQETEIRLFEEKEAMGTMGTIVHEMEHGEDPFFVTNGDELKGLDLRALEFFHQARRAEGMDVGATIALVRVPNPSDYGVAEMEGHRITRFHEKPEIPPSTLISSGLYVIEPSALRDIDCSSRFLMFEKDFFPQLAARERLAGCPLDGQWFDCGTMERWERAMNEWKGI